MDKITKMIKDAAPQILIVGLGAPKQEKFIYHKHERLGVPVSLGLGASLDFEAGQLSVLQSGWLIMGLNGSIELLKIQKDWRNAI